MSTNSVPDQLLTLLVWDPEGNIISDEQPMREQQMLKFRLRQGPQNYTFYSETSSFEIRPMITNTEKKIILFTLNDVEFATANLSAEPLQISMHDSKLGPSIKFIPRYGLVFPHPRFPCLTTINRTRGFEMGEFKGLWEKHGEKFKVGTYVCIGVVVV